MASVIPAPPGFHVGFADAASRRFAPPSPANLFAIGFTDRGDVGQASNLRALTDMFGSRTNYSVLFDSLAAAMAESGATVTVARVVGPAAASATVDLDDAASDPVVTLTATSAGDWAHGVKVTVTADGSNRTVTMTQDGAPVASGLVASTDDVVALLEPTGLVTVEAGAGSWPPAAMAETAMSGGDDDRGNATTADYQAALDKLDRRYGPGIILAPGITDSAVHAAVLAHGADRNRRAFLDLASGADKSAAILAASGLRSTAPDHVRFGGLFASHAYVRAVAGEPERLVPFSAVMAGVASRVFRTQGMGVSPFGPKHGARVVSRLASEWSDQDRHDLYVAGVNVATDDGESISVWGGTTLDLDPLHQELHHAGVRVSLKFDAERIMRQAISDPIDALTFTNVHTALEAMCATYQEARALFTGDGNPAYVVDVAGMNDEQTMAARELHAAIRVRQTNTVDWADLLISVHPTTDQL